MLTGAHTRRHDKGTKNVILSLFVQEHPLEGDPCQIGSSGQDAPSEAYPLPM